MAVEYFDLQAIKRSSGQSIVAKASYNSGDTLTDDRIGKTFDYGKKSGIVHSELFFPEGMEVCTRENLWNRVESSETRINSQLGRSIEIALPLELNQKQRIDLARDIAKNFSQRYDCPVDMNIHEPTKRKPGADVKAENPHTHILIPDRDRNGQKLRALSEGKKKDAAGQTEIDRMRDVIEEITRQHLDRAGHRYTAYTLKKKPPLAERIATHEEALRKIERRIAAIERGIIRLETRNRDAQRLDPIPVRGRVPGDANRSQPGIPRTDDQGTPHGIQGIRHTPDATTARRDHDPDSTAGPARDRADPWGAATERDVARLGGEGGIPGTGSWESATKCAEALNSLHHRLEQLKEQATQEAINGKRLRKIGTEEDGTGSPESGFKSRRTKTQVSRSGHENQGPKRPASRTGTSHRKRDAPS